MAQSINPKHKKYAQAYSENSFWHKVTTLGKKAGKIVLLNALKLYYAMKLGKTTVAQMTAIISALGYFISPIDAISDFLPGGLVDDGAVLAAAVAAISACSDPDVVEAAENKLSEWFPSDNKQLDKE